MSILTLVLVVLIILLVVGGIPSYGFLHNSYGYAPLSVGGILLIVLLVLLLTGRL